MSSLKALSRTVYVSDIDGTIIKYYYDDKNLVADARLLNETLRNAKPFAWTRGEGIFTDENTIIFITGRRPDQRDLTHQWMHQKFGIYNYALYTVPFTSATQYVSDKTRMIVSRIEEVERYSPCQSFDFIVIEDDTRVLEEMRKYKKRKTNIELWFVDKNGQLHKDY